MTIRLDEAMSRDRRCYDSCANVRAGIPCNPRCIYANAKRMCAKPQPERRDGR